MPIYEYRCENCERKFSEWADLGQRTAAQPCKHCQGMGRRVLSATRVFGEYEMYRCPITEKPVEGRVNHRENLKGKGMRLMEPGEKEQMLERKAHDARMLEKAMETTVGETVASWPQEKQAKLAQEAEHFTVAVERGTPS